MKNKKKDLLNKKKDWIEIKKLYLNSDIDVIQDFLKSELCIKPNIAESGFWKSKTKGWKKEKQEIKEQINKKIIQKTIDDMSSNSELILSQIQLLKAKKLILQSTIKRVNDTNSKLRMQELKTALEIIKLELGEPTKIDQVQGDINQPFLIKIISNLNNE